MTSIRPITDKALREAISAAETKVAEQRDKIRMVEESLRGAERELVLLVELGRLRGMLSQSATNGVSAAGGVEEADSNLPRVTYGSSSSSSAPGREALVRTVIDVLREHGEPMPIRALMAEVVSRGAHIPGRGEQANLISVITRVPEITRPHRGVYGLRERSPDGDQPMMERAVTGRRPRSVQ
jgi:hypothetical protein